MNADYERNSLDDALTDAHLKVGNIESTLKCLQKYCWENYEIEWPVVTDMVPGGVEAPPGHLTTKHLTGGA